jgi:hypothetical protein
MGYASLIAFPMISDGQIVNVTHARRVVRRTARRVDRRH